MPVIKLLEPADAAMLEAFLLPQLDSSLALLGNSRAGGLVDTGEPHTGTYAAAIEGDRLVGVVAHYWNGQLFCQAPVEWLGELWPLAVERSGRSLRGVLGPPDQVEVIRAGLALPAEAIRLDSLEELYGLELGALVLPDGLHAGGLHAGGLHAGGLQAGGLQAGGLQAGGLRGRRAGARDLDLLADWRASYSLEILGVSDSIRMRASCRSTMRRSLRQGRTWVLEAAGQPVACSSFNVSISEAVQVAGVWTPPEFRRRGYGRAVVAASLAAAHAQGTPRAVLFTARSNLPAQAAYRALGFSRVGDFRLLLLED